MTAKQSSAGATPEPLAYDIAMSCQLDQICRTKKYQAINPDPSKRRGLPFLRTFKVGSKRLMTASDHREWLAELQAASMAKASGLEKLEATNPDQAA
jgi:hypothetical protein